MSAKRSLVGTALSLWNREDGAIISAELVLVMTIAVLAMVVGLSSISHSINSELKDIADAFGAISQSFLYTGISGSGAAVSGSSFNDDPDFCDCIPLDHNVGHLTTPDKCE